MPDVSKDEIIRNIESLTDRARLSFRLSSTFGGGVVLLELNPARGEKGQKKYLMWWGPDETKAKAKGVFLASDKAKSLASWVADRAPRLFV